MSMNPVLSLTTVPEMQSAQQPDVRLPRSGDPQAEQPWTRPNLGTQPNRDSDVLQSNARSSEMPQDEVQVQRDSGGSGQIVIRYLDGSGNLILQVPSEQVLGLSRAIEEALNQQNKSRDTSAVGPTNLK